MRAGRIASKMPADAACSDLELLERMADRDAAALELLYARHGARLLSFLSGQVSDRRLAEEVLQDVMMAAWKRAGSFRGDCRVLTWLLIIARRRALNARRPRRLQSIPTDPQDLARSPIDQDAGAGALQKYELDRALAELPQQFREPLELVFFQGLTVDETAAVLGVPSGTVKSRMHRGRARLRDLMEPDSGDSDGL
jgi:RNA polymerase sigma factor (sigma-70 family)